MRSSQHLVFHLAFAYLIGILIILNLPQLPPIYVDIGLLLSAVIVLLTITLKSSSRHILLVLFASLVAASYCLHQARDIRSEQLSKASIGQKITVDGWVASLPVLRETTSAKVGKPANRDAQFLFRPVKQQEQEFPQTLRISWYRNAPELKAGDFLRLTLRLKPPRGRLNFTGFDFERWLFRQQIGALGSVSAGQFIQAQELSLVSNVQLAVLKWRQQLAVDLEAVSINSSTDATALIRALSIADRSGIGSELRDLFARTGTAHLLAISGLHIGLVASFGFMLGNLFFPLIARIWPRLSARLGKRRLALLPGMLFALTYATLAGWTLPTQRAVIMLLVIAIGLSLRRKINPWSGWSLALLLVLIFDPLSPLDAGFWLSFTAVACLILMLSGRQSGRRPWQSMLRAQWVVVIALMPLTILLFSRIPMASLFSNLLAIPLTGFLLVPLTMAAIMLIGIAPGLAGLLLSSVAWLLDRLVLYLQWLDKVIPVIDFQLGELSSYALPAIATIAVLLLLLPRPMPIRWLGLVWLLPLLLLSNVNKQFRLEVLDVGQGLAVLVETPNELLLYDSGPGDGKGRDLVASVVQPAVNNTGKELTTIVISHADLDHAGGLYSLRKLYPHADYFLSKPTVNYAKPCNTQQNIYWPNKSILKVLHPNPELPYLGNDSSCVLALELAGQNVLLSGDIGQVIEQRILRLYPTLQADTLIIPHHGSLSSSSVEFIKQINPQLALVSSGFANRFKLPADKVINRYLDHGSKVFDTARCGAIRVDFNHNGETNQLSTARAKRKAIWRMGGEGC